MLRRRASGPDSIFRQPLNSHQEFQIQRRDLATQSARVLLTFRHPRNRGRAERRMLNASAASRAKGKKHTSAVTTNTPKSSGVPHAMGYGLLRALPGDRSTCFVTVVATEDVSLPGWAGLSGATFANVRASGPHDLGRPGNVVVSASSAPHGPFWESALLPHPRLTLPRPPHPAPRP